MHTKGRGSLSNPAAAVIASAPASLANAVQMEDVLKTTRPVLPSADIKYRVLIADDHPMFREALVECVRRTIPLIEIVEAWDLQTLQAAITNLTEFDLLVLDLNMPGVNGLSALVHVRSLAPGIAVIVIAELGDCELIKRAIGVGAAGFLVKSALMSTISKAIATVLAGGISIPESDFKADLEGGGLSAVEIDAARRIGSLTPLQYRITTLLTWGLNNKQIAWELGVSETTVRSHISSIFKSLQVRNRSQVVVVVQVLDFERSSQMQSYGRDWGLL